MAARISSRELPVDRGWSWVVCLASFVCMFVTGTAMQALSVLFLELVNEFSSSVTVTSLTVMCFVMSLSVSSVVSTSVLVPIFGERPVIIVAGALFSACSIGYFLAPNIALFIAFAAGKGTCVGLIFVPAISLLSYYFNRRRSLATTISNSGICVASIVSPPIIRVLAAEYGLRGTFLILAAFELHMLAAGMLMRPVSAYRTIPKDGTALTELADDEPEMTTQANKIQDSKSRQPEDAELQPDSLSSPLRCDNDRSRGYKPYDHFTRDKFAKNVTAPGSEDEDVTYSTSPNHKMANNHAIEPLLKNSEIPDIYNMEDNSSDLKSVSRQSSTNEPSLSRESQKISPVCRQISKKEVVSRQSSRRGSAPRRGSASQNSGSNWSINGRQSDLAVHRGSILSVTSGMEPAVTGIGLQLSTEEEVPEKDGGWKSCCCFVVLRRIFDPYLFSQWAYRIYLVSALPSATTQYLLQYIPTIAVIKGATKDQGATLLTIVGSVDLVSRLAVGVFADTHILRPTQIVAIAQICQGILLQFNPLFDNYEKMIAMVVIMGLFIGTRQSLMPMMHIEIVGIEKLARCLSITAMIATISAACHSPMLSAIMEATGSYNIVLHYVGVALITGAVLILFTPLLERVDARRGKETAT